MLGFSTVTPLAERLAGFSSFCMLGAMTEQSRGMRIASRILLVFLIGILLALAYVLVRYLVLG